MRIFISCLFVIFFTTIFSSSSYSGQKMINRSLSVERTERQLSLGKEIENTAGGNGIGGIGATTLSDDNNNFSDKIGFDANMSRQIREINARRAAENGNYQNDNIQSRRTTFSNGLPPTSRRQNNKNIINIFCSNKYKIKTNASKAEISCINTMRQQACERFKRSTINVQRTLSKSIDCESNTSGYSISGCDSLDANRLNLLKQYWQDESTSYTILFLPDMVLNTTANCATSTRGRTAR